MILAAIPALAWPQRMLLARVLRGNRSGGSPSGASQDGAFISDTNNPAPLSGGTWFGSGGVLRNNYGLWTLGIQTAPAPGYSPGNNFHRVLCNGLSIAEEDPFLCEACIMRIDFGGNLWFLGHDVLWTIRNDYTWQGNASSTIGPPDTGSWDGPPLTFVSPPYAPSPDGTFITSTGTVTSGPDGVWSIVGGNAVLNGLTLGGPFACQKIEISGLGQAFLQDLGGTWYHWQRGRRQLATGFNTPPGSVPVPTVLNFTDSMSNPTGRVTVNHTDPPGTFVCNVVTTTSDLSTFTGTVSADPSLFVVTGNQLTLVGSPPAQAGCTRIVSTQNGVTASEVLEFISV